MTTPDPRPMLPIVACRPVDISGLPRDFPVPDAHKGSTVGRCEICTQEIWIGPGQDELIKRTLGNLSPEEADKPMVCCFMCAIHLANLSHPDGPLPIRTLTDKVVPLRDHEGNIVDSGSLVTPIETPTGGTIRNITGNVPETPGFRIDDLWVVTCADDKMGECIVYDEIDRTALIATDNVRLDYVQDYFTRLVQAHPDKEIRLRHFREVQEIDDGVDPDEQWAEPLDKGH